MSGQKYVCVLAVPMIAPPGNVSLLSTPREKKNVSEDALLAQDRYEGWHRLVAISCL